MWFLESPHFESLQLVGQQHDLNDETRDSSSSYIPELVSSSCHIYNFMSMKIFVTITILILFMINILCSLHNFVDLVSGFPRGLKSVSFQCPVKLWLALLTTLSEQGRRELFLALPPWRTCPSVTSPVQKLTILRYVSMVTSKVKYA